MYEKYATFSLTASLLMIFDNASHSDIMQLLTHDVFVLNVFCILTIVFKYKIFLILNIKYNLLECTSNTNKKNTLLQLYLKYKIQNTYMYFIHVGELFQIHVRYLKY